MEELRGQLGDRLPGAVQLAAKAMGVTVEQLNEMVRRGEVASDEFLPKFAMALRESVRESGALAAGMDTVRAAFGRFNTALQISLAESAEGSTTSLAESFDILAVSIKSFEPIFKFLVSGFSVVARTIALVINLIGKLFDAIGVSALIDFLGDLGTGLLESLEGFAGITDQVEAQKQLALSGGLGGTARFGTNTTNNSNVVFNNSFTTTSDAQEINRTLQNQSNFQF